MRKGLLKSLVAAVLTTLAVSLAAHVLAAGEPKKTVPKQAPRLALVIGNANYVKLGRLDNPARDAHLIAEKLQQTGFEVTEVDDRDIAGMTADVEGFARKFRERGPETVSLL